MSPIDGRAFRNLLKVFPSGVVVVMAYDALGTERAATVSAFTAVSVDPPLVSVCLRIDSRTLAAIQMTRAFSINVLGEHQEHVARRYAEKAALGPPSRLTCVVFGAQVPVLDDTLATIAARVTDIHDAGDHKIVVGEVVGGRAADGRPLVHCHSHYACTRPLPQKEDTPK